MNIRDVISSVVVAVGAVATTAVDVHHKVVFGDFKKKFS